MPKKKVLAAVAVASAVAGGGIAGALVGVPSLSGAQDSGGSTTSTTAPTSTTVGSGSDRPDDGCQQGFGHRVDLAAAADVLGMTEDELRDALDADDTSIADVATDKNVELQTVIDALVADATAAIDQKVTDGDIDADQATELKNGLTEHITDLVNRNGLGGPGFGPGGPGHGFGPGMGRPGS
ncbi:MAG: hypothetical protein WKF43_14345 [Acidimicrobiales bacterium]